MAKEKCDAFKCEKLQLFITVKEFRRRDNNCLITGTKEDGSFGASSRTSSWESVDRDLLVVYCPVQAQNKISLFNCHQKSCKKSFFRGSNESSKKQSKLRITRLGSGRARM